MRIGIFTHNYPKDDKDRRNAGVFVNDFAKKLATRHSVFVFCPSDRDLVEKRDGLIVNWFDWNGTLEKLGNWKLISPLSLLSFFRLILIGSKKAIKFARANKLDYCLAAWSIPSSVFTLFIKRRLSIAYGVWSLGSDINFYSKIPILRQIIRLSLVNANNLFANSYSLCKKVNCLTDKRCVFLPAVTELGQYKDINLSRTNKVPSFLYVGRLEKVKGPDLLIKACRAVRMAGVDFRLYVLGGGSMLDKLKKMVRKYSLTPNIYFEGWADKKEIAGFMKKADILVIPSRNESLPLVLIEAARFNLPSIVSHVGDCSEVVKKYNIGLSFRKGDISGLARLMIRFAQNRNFHVDNQGFEKMLEKYSLGESVITFEHEILNR